MLDTEAYTFTDFAAWWGAVLATLVFCWDIFKHMRSGPRINIEAISDMGSVPKASHLPDTFIYITVSNNGNAPSTFKNIGFFHFKSLREKVFGKPRTQAVLTHPHLVHPLPYILKPGETWNGFIDQNKMDQFFESGFLYIWCQFSNPKKPILAKIKKQSSKKKSGQIITG